MAIPTRNTSTAARHQRRFLLESPWLHPNPRYLAVGPGQWAYHTAGKRLSPPSDAAWARPPVKIRTGDFTAIWAYSGFGRSSYGAAMVGRG